MIVKPYPLLQARVQGGGGLKGPGPPLEIEKQKKKAFRFWAPPPLRIPGHAPVLGGF